MTVPLWRLSVADQDTTTGAYKVMLSLGKMLSTGQGLLVVSVFFLDWECILNPAKTFYVFMKKKLESDEKKIPEFPVMLPVVVSNNMRLPVSLLTNISLSLAQEASVQSLKNDEVIEKELSNDNLAYIEEKSKQG